MKIFYSGSDDVLRAGLFEKIKSDMDRSAASGGEVLLVVPAQSTLSMEEEALRRVDGRGFLRLNIVSGGKLREDVLARTGGSGRAAISTIGRKMLLKRIIARLSGQFTAFSGVCNGPRFADMAGDFIVQMKQNRVDAAQLGKLAEAEGGLLGRKLADMHLIAAAYEEAMAGRFDDSEDILAFTAEKLRESTFLKNTRIYYYGFYSFTQNEAEFLRQLDAASAGLSVALLYADGDEFRALKKAFAVLGCPAEKLDAPEAVKTADGEAGPNPGSEGVPFELVSCASTYAQAESIAVRILRLVRKQGLGYSDIAVLVPEGQTHGGTIKRVLESLGIPVFMDETRSVMYSQAARLVSALLDLADGEYKGRDVLRFVKTGILDADDEALWGFEKYVKQYHIKGKAFLKPFKSKNDDILPEQLAAYDDIRQIATALLQPLIEGLAGAQTAGEKAVTLTNYLSDVLRLPEWLEDLAASQSYEGFEDSAEQTGQLWGVFEEIAEQIVQLIGEEPLSAEEFRDVYLGALQDVKLGVLPQAEGRVQIGSVKRSFIQNKKAVFLASLCDGLVPSDTGAEGVLTEKEINGLAGRGTDLSKPSDILLSEELFMLFRSAACATDLLWAGVPASDLEGNELKPSGVLERLKALYKNLNEYKDPESGEKDEAFTEGRLLALKKLPVKLREGLSGDKLPEIWKAVYNELGAGAPQIKAGLLYSADDKPLDKTAASKLFERSGGVKSLSPSRLDAFAACPFKHFVSYGLRPIEDKDFSISGREMGDILHEALLRLCEKLSAPAQEKELAVTDPASPWMTVSRGDMERMLAEILAEMAESDRHGVMTSSKEEVYRSGRILDVCSRFAWHMIEQVRAGSIDRMYFETEFGRGKTFGPIQLDTAAGKVFVEGKIDRVDVMPCGADSKLVKIIDYKSGSEKFSRELVDKGLKLQLMTYMEGALGNGKDQPAGVYYFKIGSGETESSIEDMLAGTLSDDVISGINKKYMLDGITVNDSLVLEDIDKGLSEPGASQIINVTKKADDSYTGSLISPKEMEEFRQNFRRNLQSICERLFSGEIKAEQKKHGTLYDSCRYCPYKSVCLESLER